jgi:transglutaminase-like putative cysteine protease
VTTASTLVAVTCEIGATTTAATSAILLVHAADAPGQRVVDEELRVDGGDVEVLASREARPGRLRTRDAGPVTVRYAATVELARHDPGPVSTLPLPHVAELDLDLLHWTLPSRYCPSDVLTPQALDLFGDLPRDGALLTTVRDWVRRQIVYAPGSSDGHTAADETFLRRRGVCRDQSHLTISLLRALDVPARMVAGYAPGLVPEDLHAVVEAHDGRNWHLLDPSGLAPTATFVRIATGTDATAVAWMTSGEEVLLDHITVTAASTRRHP